MQPHPGVLVVLNHHSGFTLQRYSILTTEGHVYCPSDVRDLQSLGMHWVQVGALQSWLTGVPVAGAERADRVGTFRMYTLSFVDSTQLYQAQIKTFRTLHITLAFQVATKTASSPWMSVSTERNHAMPHLVREGLALLVYQLEGSAHRGLPHNLLAL